MSIDPDLPSDDERTRMPERPPRAAVSGSAAEPPSGQNALAVGTRLGEFEVLGVIGEGGFGIVYLAYDHSLDRRVAVKEYMPSALAARKSDLTVAVKSSRHADTFEAGRRSFINEARLLAQFDHPSLLKVYRFWEANGTAYMAMPYYEGKTLKAALAEASEKPGEAWLKSLLAQLLDALDVLHRSNCYHRDIAPDNILLLHGDRPLLLDFGSARRVIGDMNQTLTVIVKPGYAPIEQYAEASSRAQGPWTDLYALAGVIYFAIMGRAPPPSIARVAGDTMVPLAQAAAGRYSPAFLQANDRALELKPEDRPQSTAEFRRLLELKVERDAPPADFLDASKANEAQFAALKTSATAPRRWLAWSVALGFFAVVGGGVLYWSLHEGWLTKQAAKAPERVAESPVPPPATEPPAVAPPSTAESAPPPSTPSTSTTSTQAANADPVAILESVYNGRDATHDVVVSVAQPTLRVGVDDVRFSVTSSRGGYVYVLVVGSTRSDLALLFPNAVDRSNRLRSNTELELPRPPARMTAQGPAGTDHFLAIVSDSPRDFSGLPAKAARPFREFALDRVGSLASSSSELGTLFAGTATCPAGRGAACPESYGAALFAVEEVER